MSRKAGRREDILKVKYFVKYIIAVARSGFYGWFLKKRREDVFRLQEKEGLDNIPIFLINYNRLSCIRSMIERLESLGKKNIIVIDNNSSYPPLLEYYKQLPYEVIRLDNNWGHKVFWENPVFEKYRKKFYVISDPDIEPIAECPADFIEVFFEYLKRNPFVRKVGFSLKIDDLQADRPLTNQIVDWEKQFYLIKLKKSNLYYAEIDTTFALYIPDELVRGQGFYNALRTGYPYQARHTPWYKDTRVPTEEDIYYSERKRNGWRDNANGEVTRD